jgi:outer membrane protein
MRSLLATTLLMTLHPQAAQAASAPLTLENALKTAQANQPQLRQAQAQTTAAQARANEAHAPLLPQLSANAGYVFGARLGDTPNSNSNASQSNGYTIGLSGSQLLFDFGGANNKWQAASSLANAQAATEQATALQVALNVRTSFFAARADKVLLAVAKETLANQGKHLNQIKGFVTIGTRPPIDLAQAGKDLANARVQWIQAQNAYETAKAQLNQAMGIVGPTDYDIKDESMAAVGGEGSSLNVLMLEATRDRPELRAVSDQVKAQTLSLDAVKTAYYPSLHATASLGDNGAPLSYQSANGSAGLALSWPFFEGGVTQSQITEATANLQNSQAQADLLQQQIRLEVEQARLALSAEKSSLVAAAQSTLNAREQLRLAEGRYAAGVGSVIELGDAQLALTTAEAQEIQENYKLATARAQLLKALGRS